MLEARKEKGFTYAGSKAEAVRASPEAAELRPNDVIDVHEAEAVEVAH